MCGTVDDAADGAAQASDCAPTPVAGSCSLRDAFAAIGGALGGVGDVTLVYATITGNSAPLGVNIGDNGGALTSFASVIAGPGGGGENCRHFSSTLSHGYDVEDDAAATCGFATATNDLAPGTALLDAVPPAACQGDILDPITTGERGVTRPQGTGCDVGAVEVTVPVSPAVPVPGGSEARGDRGSGEPTHERVGERRRLQHEAVDDVAVEPPDRHRCGRDHGRAVRVTGEHRRDSRQRPGLDPAYPASATVHLGSAGDHDRARGGRAALLPERSARGQRFRSAVVAEPIDVGVGQLTEETRGTGGDDRGIR